VQQCPQLSIPTIFNILLRRTLYYFSSYCSFASLVTYFYYCYYYYTPTASDEFRENRKTVHPSDGDSRETEERTILKLYVHLNIIRYCCVPIYPKNPSNLAIRGTDVVNHPHCQRRILFPTEKYCAKPPSTILYRARVRTTSAHTITII